jgi:hypothetical protein
MRDAARVVRQIGRSLSKERTFAQAMLPYALAVRVDEPTGSRWDLALDLLRRGVTDFNRSGDVQPWRCAPVESTWWFENVSEERARADLDQARRWTEELLASDERFREAVGAARETPLA